MQSLKLFDIDGDKLLDEFNDFYTAIEAADNYKNIKLFKLSNSIDKTLIGLRIHPNEIVWRIDRRKKRGRDNLFYKWLHKISSKLL